MYIIKQIPEDFRVKELITLDIKDKGAYAYFWLKKVEYTTLRAVEAIALKLNIPLKNIGFAGTKDKKAITEQAISIKNGKPRDEAIALKDIELKFLGYGDNPISLGDNQGNEFIITVRRIENSIFKEVKRFVNYFGEQRFSKNNAEIGKLLVKKQFNEAVKLILEGEKEHRFQMELELHKNPNNYVGALMKIPKKMIMLYIHSYQSLIWNETAAQLIDKNENISVPIIGFGSDISEIKDNNLKSIIKKIMKREGITERDFIIRELKGLSPEGDERKLYADIQDLDVLEKEKDRIKIKFKLKKGCYATEAVKALFN